MAHRIDKNTSGLLVVAKDEDTLNYLAFCNFMNAPLIEIILHWMGRYKTTKGEIEGHVGRNKINRKVMDVFLMAATASMQDTFRGY